MCIRDSLELRPGAAPAPRDPRPVGLPPRHRAFRRTAGRRRWLVDGPGLAAHRRLGQHGLVRAARGERLAEALAGGPGVFSAVGGGGVVVFSVVVSTGCFIDLCFIVTWGVAVVVLWCKCASGALTILVRVYEVK